MAHPDTDVEAMRERRDIVSGEILPEDQLIRFVASPDSEVVPDIAAVLPGRGMWVKADKISIGHAAKKNIFSKSAKAPLRATADLSERVEHLLVARMKADLGLALRSGTLHVGFDQVEKALRAGPAPSLIIAARDGSPDGKRKIFAAAHARGLKIEILDCLDSEELSLALGRENVIHAALKSGRLQERLSFDAKRLNGIRPKPEAPHERAE